jgi:hypothetical protein
VVKFQLITRLVLIASRKRRYKVALHIDDNDVYQGLRTVHPNSGGMAHN